jgi:single-stranded-DNA-specific exonuclease
MWSVRTTDLSAARELARSLSLHPLIARVLASRGVTEPAQARSLLSPKLAELTVPDAMADREEAASRIAHAIARREHIVVFGDYDVDGTTSAALLATALTMLGGSVRALVASRFDGGYGLSDEALARVLESRPSLLITCDCGTSDHPRLAKLQAKGIDAIVVDHHKVPEEPLPAVAFLNPHRPDCGFAFKGLASVGLVLSLAAAVRAKLRATLDLREFLDLVAVGTIADVAPLEGDNRILTRAGLDRLAQGKGRAGMSALVKASKMRGKPRAFDVGFSIAPMLNAPGRLGSAEPTLKLLMAQRPEDAERLARTLSQANEERRRVSQQVCDEAIAQVSAVYGAGIPAGIVVAADGWHHGVGGIVAGRVVERFGVPVIVVALDGREGVGSARAPKGWKLYDAVAQCSSDLLRFGGHDGAAGMKVRADKIESLRASFAEACQKLALERSSANDGEQVADAECSERDLQGPLAQHLDALEPTGQSWSEATVIVRGARIVDLREVGTSHLRARARVGTQSVNVFIRDGVGRRARGELPLDGLLDLLVRLRTDEWAGPAAVQFDLTATRVA